MTNYRKEWLRRVLRKLFVRGLVFALILPTVWLWSPKTITQWEKINAELNRWGANKLANWTLDPRDLRRYEQAMWVRDKVEDGIVYAIQRLPGNKRDHTEALLRLSMNWKEMGTQLLLVFILVLWGAGKVVALVRRQVSRPRPDPPVGRQEEKKTPRMPHIAEGPTLGQPRRE